MILSVCRAAYQHGQLLLVRLCRQQVSRHRLDFQGEPIKMAFSWMVGGIENEGESMPRTRKSHPPSLKAKVAVEAIKAHKTAAQIAQMFGVHPTQVGGWKKQALAGLPDIFGNGREQIRQQSDADKDELYKQIGQLKVESDFLKKRAGLID